MKSTLIRISLFLALLFLSYQNAYSTHVAGGYIQFECTGTPGEYIVRLVLYRDCSGSTLLNTAALTGTNDCGLGTQNITLNEVSVSEVSQLCQQQLNNSTCNGGSLPGYEEYIYEATVNLGACDDWTFYYNLCCRNSSNNASGQPYFHVETDFNTSVNNCTTTPTVTAQPEPFVCINQPVSYNLGAFEPDGHSLQYSLVTALEDPNDPIPYNGGYSGGTPIPGINIDPNTGTVTFTPTNTGAYIIVIQIEEYDANGNLISVTNYDYQTYVINCNNQSPQPPAGGITNVNGSIIQNGPNSVTFCQNNNGCFDVTFTDANAGDILSVQSNIQAVMPGAVVNQSGTNPLTVNVCWTPINTTGTVTLNFLVEDDACPIQGQTNYAANVNVQNSMSVDLGPDINVSCGGTANLTTNVVGGSGNYSYMWNDNPALNGPTLNNVGAGTYWVEVTDNSGTGCNAYDTIVVTETVPPTPDFTFSQTCDGDAMTLTDNSTPGDGNITDYNWDFDGDGNFDANGTPVNHTFSGQGNFGVTLEVIDDNGCSDQVTLQVTVDPNPVANFNASTECLGDITTFQDQSNIISGNITAWEWDFDDGSPLDNNQNPTHTYASAGTYDVTLTVTSDQGCTGSITETVEVYTEPTVDFTPTTVCLNTPTDFQDLSSDPSGIVNWEWDFDDGSGLNVNQNPIHTYSNAGTYDVTLTVTTNNGCTNSITQQVEVMPLPTADFNFTEVCEYLPTDFTDNSNVAAPSVIEDYYWDIQNDGSTEYQTQNASHQYNSYGTYTVELMVETDFGCKDSITYDVDVHPQPTADFFADPLCLGLPTDFQDQSTIPLGNVTGWEWDFGDGSPLDNTQNPNHQYGNSGQFNVLLSIESDQGCEHDTTKTVEIYDLPTAGFNFNNECFNESIVFQENASANSSQFEWDFGDGNTSIVADPQHQYNSPGDYDVELIVTTANGNCKDTIEQTVTAYPLPQPNFSLNNACLNDVVNVNDQSNIAAPSSLQSFEWHFGDGNTGNNASNSNVYASEGIYDIKLIVTSNHGCKDSITQSTTVYPLPQVDFSPTDVCLDYPTQFTDLSTVSNAFSNNSNVQWDWNFDDGTTDNVQNPVHTYNNPGVYDVMLTVTTNNGCTNAANKIVNVYPAPDVSFTGSNLYGCSPLCFNLQSTSSVDNSFTPNNPSVIHNYQWNLSGGFSANTGNVPSLGECFENNTTDPELYDVQLIVTTDKGCIDSTTVNDYIQVNDNPIADFTFSPQAPTIVEPVIQMNNQSANADQYQWIVEDAASSTEENPEFEFAPEPETYLITLIAETLEGCKDEMTSTVEVLDELIMYVPNTFTPDGDEFNETFLPVMTSGFNPYDYTLLIYNRYGEPVFESHNHTVGWDGRFQGKIARQGVYVWKIIIKDSKYDDKKEFYGHVTLLK